MREVPTPSDSGGSPLHDFIALRDSLRQQRIGHGGREVCAALTASLDETVSALVAPGATPMAVVALGGYGRGELSLYSDVDLMLLHDVGDAATAAADLFRPLWDAKLRVGHSVRTVREASDAARERFDTQTTLLTSRLVAGSEELFDQLMGAVTRVTRARPLRRYLVDAERSRRAEAPYRLMAIDIKTGRGGLRALQGFEWERRRQELIGRFSTQHQQEEEHALEVLLRVRNALHAVTGRAHDVYSPELREPVARWLGADTFETAGDLVAAMQSIDRLAERKWPEIVEDRPVPAGRRVWSRVAGPNASVRPDSPPSMDDLDRLLEAGEPGRAIFDSLWEAGHLSDVLPEWAAVATLPQLEPFHQHPVAAHLWRTVAEMQAVLSENGPLGDVALQLDQPRLLRLAAFLHDIGKGRGGEHAKVGAEIAAAFAERMGLDAKTTDLLVSAVRHHLLLPRTATRRDLADPAVIDEVASELGSLQLLQVLYLLTIADSRATGPSMWNDWKASLLKTLFLGCATRFGAEEPPLITGGATRQEAMARSGRATDAMAAHLDAMPDDYLRSLTVEEVLWHLELVSDLVGVSNLGVRVGEPIETVVVVGPSLPGFRRTVAAVFAANGVDVLEARLFGRSDGLVVDSFRVIDDRTGGTVPGERWDRVRVDVEAGLLGQLDTDNRVATRAAAYPLSEVSRPQPSARISTDPAT
ncbi:MAG TPA: HD domain-containing protein, partial [Acidimicrobiia bacterium]|nr:HD domain-containing protein [Acidimicrobiia bacterium]